MLEKDIERVLVCMVREAGGIAYKFTSPGNDGVPDRIVCLPGGTIVFVELKTDTGRVTDLQQVQIRRLRELGQMVIICRGIKGVYEFLKMYRLEAQAEKVKKGYDL